MSFLLKRPACAIRVRSQHRLGLLTRWRRSEKSCLLNIFLFDFCFGLFYFSINNDDLFVRSLHWVFEKKRASSEVCVFFRCVDAGKLPAAVLTAAHLLAVLTSWLWWAWNNHNNFAAAAADGSRQLYSCWVEEVKSAPNSIFTVTYNLQVEHEIIVDEQSSSSSEVKSVERVRLEIKCDSLRCPSCWSCRLNGKWFSNQLTSFHSVQLSWLSRWLGQCGIVSHSID